jgi:hypothetical protein
MILTTHNHSGNGNDDERGCQGMCPEIMATQVRLNIVSRSVRLNLSIVGLP